MIAVLRVEKPKWHQMHLTSGIKIGPLKSCLNYVQQSICISWVSDLLSKTQPALSS